MMILVLLLLSFALFLLLAWKHFAIYFYIPFLIWLLKDSNKAFSGNQEHLCVISVVLFGHHPLLPTT
jgi:hypothetical protein